ncbi:MAG: flagellar basal body P-ring formation chaperone FlgA [Pseudomonadota bacterium]
MAWMAAWFSAGLAALVVAGGLAGAAAAADTLRMALKPSASVADSVIRFGDIFLDPPANLAGTAMAPAPGPGETVTYDAAWLIRAVRRQGLDWRPANRYVEIAVTRAGVRVSAEESVSRIAEAIKQRYRIDGSLDVEVESELADAHLPAGAAVRSDISDLHYDRRSNAFRAVIVLAAGEVERRIPVFGRAYEIVMAPMLVRNLGRGDRIAASDLRLEPYRVDELPLDAVLRAQDLLGMDASRVIRAGVPVRQADVAQAQMIERGAIVAIVFKTPAMTLTSQGRALENGATGATIRVSNTQTNRVIHARVVAPNQVRVMNAAQLANR